MNFSQPRLVIVAKPASALAMLGGISLLERLLRQMQRLDFREAVVLTNAPEIISAQLAKPSPPRAEILVTVKSIGANSPTIAEIGDGPALILSAGFYYDRRLLLALARKSAATLLVDSEMQLISEAALVTAEWLAEENPASLLFEELSRDSEKLDAANEPAYMPDQRRSIRPRFFPAPNESEKLRAEKILRDTTQKGTLDIPAYIHAPIESWIVSKLCRTAITPNQITSITAVVGICVTIAFATGNLWIGALLALSVGIMDGCDGKLARLKVETTPAGKYEHVIDYLVEQSWWIALAFHFFTTREVPNAFALLAILFVIDWGSRLMKGVVMRRTGRTLDDASQFDRALRFVAARRNIYIWTFTGFLICGAAAKGFLAIFWIGVISGAIHIVRGFQVAFTSSRRAG